MKSTALSRFFFLITIVWCCLWLTGCTTSWISEATNIINLLVPSITAILGILSAFGIGLPATVMTAVESWANAATTGLQTVGTLIGQYQTAEESAKPGILVEIQTALSVITNNLATILPQIHVDDPTTQAKIMAVIQAVQVEITALINLVPALQGKVTSADDLKSLMAELKSPKEYKADFNAKAGVFGREYEIK